MILYDGEIITTENGVIKLSERYKDLLNKSAYHIDCSTITGQIKAYEKCDVVRSVLGKSSSFIANLRIWALNADGSENTTTEAKKEIAKLNRPNPKEDRKIFFKKLDQKCKLHGKAYVKRVNSSILVEEFYYVIPNQFVTEIYKNTSTVTFDREIDYLQINTGTESYQLKQGNFHIFYDVTCEDNNTSFYGASRLESLSEVISTYVTLWEVLTEMYGDRGALNIISMGINDPKMMALPQTEKAQESFYEKLKNKFGTRRGQNKNIVTPLSATVNPISAKMADMMFAETIKDCKKSIANAYEIPPELLGIESSRFKTVPEARKEAYTQSAITSMEYYISEWLTMRGMIDLPFIIAPDYSHLDFYQEAQLQKAVAFQQMANAVSGLSKQKIEGKPIITWDQAQILLDLK